MLFGSIFNHKPPHPKMRPVPHRHRPPDGLGKLDPKAVSRRPRPPPVPAVSRPPEARPADPLPGDLGEGDRLDGCRLRKSSEAQEPQELVLGASDLPSCGVELRRPRPGRLGVPGGDERRPRNPRPRLGQEGGLASGRVAAAEVAGVAEAEEGEVGYDPIAPDLPEGLQGGPFAGAEAPGGVDGDVGHLALPPPAQGLDRFAEDEGVVVADEGPSLPVAAGECCGAVGELHQGGVDPLRQGDSVGEPRRAAPDGVASDGWRMIRALPDLGDISR